MSQIDTIPDMAGPLARDLSSFDAAPDVSAGQLVPYGGAPLITAGPRQVTAQKVPVPRDLGRVMARIRQNCAAFGDMYVYSWQVNNRRQGTKDTIEGGTIKLANMLLQVFGNCSVDVDVTTQAKHQVFKAWFVDLETGFCSGRLFQQNLNPNIGTGMEAERRADMVFQIGQSKAIRNVVLNALGDLASFAIEESKKALLAKFETQEAKSAAWAFIEKTLADNDIAQARAFAVIGRSFREATVQNLALLYMKCRGIKDGLTNAEDEFPSIEDAEIINEDAKDAQEERRAKPRNPSKRGQGKEKADGEMAAGGASGGGADGSGVRGGGGNAGLNDGGGRSNGEGAEGVRPDEGSASGGNGSGAAASDGGAAAHVAPRGGEVRRDQAGADRGSDAPKGDDGARSDAGDADGSGDAASGGDGDGGFPGDDDSGSFFSE